jgi:phage major head subunit gpT-like protein
MLALSVLASVVGFFQRAAGSPFVAPLALGIVPNNDALSSRAVTGMYYEKLQSSAGLTWLDAISNYFTSDQSKESYLWLGMPPALREWISGRQAKGFAVDGIEITNKHFEATIEFALKDMRRDKTAQIQARIAEFAERGQTHFAKLVSTLIANGAAGLSYDGHYFFDTAHVEGDSGTQSNSISTTIAGLPATAHGSTTAPSPEEMQQAILRSVSQMLTFVDDQGEPLNETAQQFMVMVPVGLSQACMSALSTVRQAAATTFDVTDNFKIGMAVNPRLTAAGWTTKFVTFRTDGSIKPLIRQEETSPTLKVKDENSEFAFDTDKVQFGIDTWRNVGYGRWQGAVLNTLA